MASSNQGIGRLDLAMSVERKCFAQAGTDLGPERGGGRGSPMARVLLEDLLRSRVSYRGAGIQLARWSLIHLVSRLCRHRERRSRRSVGSRSVAIAEDGMERTVLAI